MSLDLTVKGHYVPCWYPFRDTPTPWIVGLDIKAPVGYNHELDQVARSLNSPDTVPFFLFKIKLREPRIYKMDSGRTRSIDYQYILTDGEVYGKQKAIMSNGKRLIDTYLYDLNREDQKLLISKIARLMNG